MNKRLERMKPSFVSSAKTTKRRRPMKRTIARVTLAVISIATLYMSVVPAAQADDHCSTANVAGDWGLTLTGTLFLPTGPVLGAAVGKLSFDASGNASGTEARNVGGSFANETVIGAWTVNSDCTGVLTANIYQSDLLVRTSVLSFVFDDHMGQVRMVQQSLTLPDGTQIPVVMTVEGRKQSFDHGHRS
jgi:hypothetical protein